MMASKRKKTRPTKCFQNFQLLEAVHEKHFDLHEDEADRLQRFINKSEDGMDSCFDRIQQSPVKNILGPIERVGRSRQKTLPENTNSNQSPRFSGYEQFLSNVKSHILKRDKTGDLMPEESIDRDLEKNSMLDCNSLILQVHKEVTSRMNGTGLSPGNLTNGLLAVKEPPAKKARVKNDESPRYKCSICKYMTKRSDHYKRHLITHTTDKPLKCTICDYNTGRSDHYKRHLHRHGLSEKEVNELCTQNGVKLKYAFSSQDMAAKSQSDRQCQECKKIFIDRNAMLAHRSREHPTLPKLAENTECANSTDATLSEPTNKKRHTCENCGYSTNVKYHMVRHKKVHARQPDTYCRECQRSYKTQGFLQLHRCKSKNCECCICKKIFVDVEALMEHTASQHALNDELLSLKGTPVSDISHHDEAEKRLINETEDDAKSEETACSNNTQENIKVVDTPVSDSSTEKRVEFGSTNDLERINCDSEANQNTSIQSCSQTIVFDVTDSDNAIDDQSPAFVPKAISESEYFAQGNLRCTKCGEWFNKLREYTLHPCIS